MGTAIVHSPAAEFSPAQLDLIRRTVASDCNTTEFDLFVTVARHAELDPFRKQISAIVFNKGNAEKRKMAIITTIDGFRVIAERTGIYRPDEDEPDYTYDADAKGPLNPLGLVKAKVYAWKGEKKAAGVAYWEEFAPIKDEWGENEQGKWKPTGKQTLDTGGNWGKMPRLMLAKCAEAQALRKAFPERLSGLYERAEFDRTVYAEFTPSEAVTQFQTEERLLRIGAANGIMLQMQPQGAIESVPLGKVADRVIAAAKSFMIAKQLDWFESANQQPLREFWARAPGDALEVKKALETERARLSVTVEA